MLITNTRISSSNPKGRSCAWRLYECSVSFMYWWNKSGRRHSQTRLRAARSVRYKRTLTYYDSNRNFDSNYSCINGRN